MYWGVIGGGRRRWKMEQGGQCNTVAAAAAAGNIVIDVVLSATSRMARKCDRTHRDRIESDHLHVFTSQLPKND